MIELKRAIGMEIDRPVRLRDPLEALIPAPISDTVPANSRDAVADASETRADVRMVAAEVRLAEARVSDALARARFDMSLVGGYMRMNSRFPQFGINDLGQLEPVHGVFHYISAGAMVTLPLRNRNQGEVAAAHAEQTGAQARLEATELAARAEIAAAEAQDAAGRRALAVTTSMVGLAAKNLDVIRQAYELGRTTANDVLTEQRRYLDIERANTETMKAAYDAHVALMAARGEL
jgi:outer membrane protein, heavy metal efflux system